MPTRCAIWKDAARAEGKSMQADKQTDEKLANKYKNKIN